MFNAIKKWWHNEQLEEVRARAKQQGYLVTQQAKEIKELRKNASSARRTAKMHQEQAHEAYEHGAKNSTRLPWIWWKDEQPYTHHKGREKLILLMASGKTITAYVQSKHRATGGDMFSGTTMWLETGFGEKVNGHPIAWLPLEMPEGFDEAAEAQRKASAAKGA